FVCRAAAAVSMWTELKTGKVDDQRLKFDIRVEKTDDGGRKFEVVVAGKSAELSPLVEGHLLVRDGETEIVRCDVEKQRSEKDVKYTFTVGAKYLAKSQFTFGNMAHDSNGRAMPAGDFYWF